jgi:hypothetical protein
MSLLDYFLYFGYPQVKFFTRILPVGKILYTYPYPRVKFHTHTLTRRVGYPRVKLSSIFLPWFWISWPCSYLSPCSYGSYSITSSLAVESQNSLVSYPLFNRQSKGFIKFLKNKSVVPQWSLKSLIYALFLKKAYFCAFLSILLLRLLFDGAVGKEDIKANLLLIFC